MSTKRDIPAEETIVVTVGGEVWTEWTYDASTNTVTVSGLQGGEEVVVTYAVADDCS